MAPLEHAVLIGLDWGSTGLRAFLIDANGEPLATRSAALGASTLSGQAAFEQALDQICGDWQRARPSLPVLACGMVGSKHGWREVPYRACPAGAADLRADAGSGLGLPIVPGLLYEAAGVPDVMRGEETQIIGALARRPELAAEACIVLPGTHSKWAQVQSGRITGFATHMTGELYALLRQHSVLGRLMPEGEAAPDTRSFLAGVDAARDGAGLGLPQQLFAVRTLGLTERLPAHGLADYLSGLLIGHELRAGLQQRVAATPLALIGEPALCERYALALQRFGVQDPLLLANTAATGLWVLAGAMEMMG